MQPTCQGYLAHPAALLYESILVLLSSDHMLSAVTISKKYYCISTYKAQLGRRLLLRQACQEGRKQTAVILDWIPCCTDKSQELNKRNRWDGISLDWKDKAIVKSGQIIKIWDFNQTLKIMASLILPRQAHSGKVRLHEHHFSGQGAVSTRTQQHYKEPESVCKKKCKIKIKRVVWARIHTHAK